MATVTVVVVGRCQFWVKRPPWGSPLRPISLVPFDVVRSRSLEAAEVSPTGLEVVPDLVDRTGMVPWNEVSAPLMMQLVTPDSLLLLPLAVALKFRVGSKFPFLLFGGIPAVLGMLSGAVP
jgi:hypothetical protein